MKVIPVYLPQFHRIPENDKWWGEGFTEWTNVKKARPLFDGHYQPREPLNDYYYDLSNLDTLKWQCNLANEYGIYGFCFYHYWFNGHLLLEKPMEMLLANPNINIRYCVSWANHNWEDTWRASSGGEKTLISHDFDDETDWVPHFEYLLQFFKDPRYICEDNKPLLVIYIPNIINKLNKMLTLWNELAIKSGFDGIKFCFQSAMSNYAKNWDRSLFDYAIEFHPGYVNLKGELNWMAWMMKYSHRIKKALGIKSRIRVGRKNLARFNYDNTWQNILDSAPSCDNAIPSAFVDWDNTPRKIERGSVCDGANPTKFKKYFKQLITKTRREYKQDKIFVFAWNEWAEGGYLEPDKKFGDGYLRAIRESLLECNEFEDPENK